MRLQRLRRAQWHHHTCWMPACYTWQCHCHPCSPHVSASQQSHLRQLLQRCPWAVAPPGFCNSGEVRYGSIGGLEYEVPQSRLYCLCINVALCSTALQCICRVIRRSSMPMKAHTYYIIFGRPPMGEASPLPPGGATVHGSNVFNPTHRIVKTLDPQTNPTHNPIELDTTNNKASGKKKTT